MERPFHTFIRKAAAALLMTAAGTLPMLADGTIPYRASFDNAQMRYSSKGEYSKIKSTDIATYGEIGAPALPVRTYRFVVPVYTGKFTVSMTLPEKASETVTLEKPLMPRQPQKWNDDPQEKITANSNAYNKVYEPKAWVVNDYFIDGSNHIVTVAVMPVEYNPVASTMKYYPYVDIKLNYTDVAENEMSSRPVFTKRPDPNLDLSKIAVNGESPRSYGDFLQEGERIAGAYVIITPSAYKSAFNELAEWKRSKGYYVVVRTLESILSSSAYAAGDWISNINDAAGKLRMCLRDYYTEYGRSYVLLAGDYHTDFPIRITDTQGMGYPGLDDLTPTDVYFSDMTGNWDANQNGKYGEIFDDPFSMSPDMIVGRLLCKNAQEVENYTRKLMLYERNPGLGDYSYLSKGLISYSNEFNQFNYDYYIKNSFSYNLATLQEMISKTDEKIYNSSEVIAEMNNGYGFNIISGHGQPHNITISKTKSGFLNLLWAKDEYKDSNAGATITGFDKLTDISKPSILYANSCTTIPFDLYDAGYYNKEYTLGAAYTVAGLYGGVSYIGYTRAAGSSQSSIHVGDFLKFLQNGANIGEVFSKARFEQVKNDSGNSFTVGTCIRYSLIGDPEMNVWTETPRTFSFDVTSDDDGGTVFNSTELPFSFTTISDGKKILSSTWRGIKTSATIPDVNNKCVTFTKPGCLPQSFLFIDNSSINDERKYFITSGTVKGVQIGNGGKVTIYASGNVILDGGFTVSRNGSLEIITDGNIMVGTGTLAAGGTISLKARGEIRVSPMLNKAAGSILNISYIR